MTRTRFELAALQLVLLFTFAFLVLFGFAAHAQNVLVAPAAPPTQAAWVTTLLQYIVAPLVAVIGSMLAWVLAKLATWIHSKEANSKAAGAFAVAADYLSTAFTHLRAGIGPDLKLALADGTLDASERAELVKKLVGLAKVELPTGVLAVLGKTLGPALETWLSGRAGEVVQAVVAAPASPGELAVVAGPT